MDDLLRLMNQTSISTNASNTSPAENVEKTITYMDIDSESYEDPHEQVTSPSARRVLARYEKLLLECLERPTICRELLNILSTDPNNNVTIADKPNSRSAQDLKEILAADKRDNDPYATFGRDECLEALLLRGVHLENPETLTRRELRDALEHAEHAFFPFLKLPMEVRVMIYKHALSYRGTIKDPYTVTPALLAVNKQIHQESLPVFHSINCFQLRACHVMQSSPIGSIILPYHPSVPLDIHPHDKFWLQHIGPENVATLRQVCFTPDMGTPQTRSVCIDLSHSDATKWGYAEVFCICNDCEREGPETLGEWLESSSELVEEMRNDPTKTDLHRRVSEEMYKKDQRRVDEARKMMNTFSERYGKGKRVKPTIEGLTLLANGVRNFLRP
ncbi:hypothetical protein KCV07_g2043, partial [Aureobasidium melanogenum]